MMIIIPHPTEILKLRNYQKKIVRENFNKDFIFYSSKPLEINVPCQISQENPKKTASLIKKIEIQKAEFSEQKSEFFCPVYIFTENQKYESELTLVTVEGRVSENFEFSPNAENQKKSTEETDFPLCLKIFRVGNKISLSQTASAVEDAVWKKL